MRIFLVGVSCVGKTTIGEELGTLRGVPFFDLDKEIENYFRRPIARLQAECITPESFRKRAAEALARLLARSEAKDCVIALPPSGLMSGYWYVVKRARGVVVVLKDRPRNIVQRLTFYDDDSRPIEKTLTDREEQFYATEVAKDAAYFGRSYRKADLRVDIAGLNPQESAAKVNEVLSDAADLGHH